MTCCNDHGPFGDGWHAKEDMDELSRLREALEAIIELVRHREDVPDTVSPAIALSIEGIARNALKKTTRPSPWTEPGDYVETPDLRKAFEDD